MWTGAAVQWNHPTRRPRKQPVVNPDRVAFLSCFHLLLWQRYAKDSSRRIPRKQRRLFGCFLVEGSSTTKPWTTPEELAHVVAFTVFFGMKPSHIFAIEEGEHGFEKRLEP